MPDSTPKNSHIWVNGIISSDKMPYLQIDIDGHMVTMTMADARNVARDIEQQCARTEVDAMIYRFFDKQEYPLGAAVALMMEFRSFRDKLDDEPVEKTRTDPDAG